MTKRIKVPKNAGGVVSFHLDEQNPIHTHEVVDGHIDCEECAERLASDEHRTAFEQAGFEIIEG